MVASAPTLADIIREYGEVFQQHYKLNLIQKKACRAISHCRTEALGAYKETCDHCGKFRIAYNPCRNRHCPQCQFVKREQWIHARKEELLDTRYFHVVFTVPDMLKVLFRHKPKILYRILFKASAEALLAACKDPKHLGARVGIISVLHTWGQQLQFHPHIHCIVSGGGLDDSGLKWVKSRSKYLVPVKVLSALFRGKFLDYLKQEKLDIPQLRMNQLYQQEWVVYAKPAFAGPEKVIEYLGRYTHRVALNNSRIIKVEAGKVFFKYKDYADGDKKKIMALPVLDFMQRFFFHVLPFRLVRIRYAGFLSNSTKKAMLVKLRDLLQMAVQVFVKIDWQSHLAKRFGEDLFKCPHCNVGRFVRKGLFIRRN